MLRNPEQMTKLRADPELIRPMLEETLRIEAPIQYTYRMAKRDFELFGEHIQSGEIIVLVFASANRDRAVFDCPHQFDIARKPNSHLTFGYGLHHCVGTQVARQPPPSVSLIATSSGFHLALHLTASRTTSSPPFTASPVPVPVPNPEPTPGARTSQS
ncbi:cytochrome P450 [Enhygromyxa salina]|uniref:cytochrome P450 n=1 Tax=Enhygromyxa salina TaxID=215803 RepID=UPI0004E62256|nr:cytochrome P450 [Enhygromyxa salina]